MKQANLISILSASNHLDEPLFKSYLDHYSIEIKPHEIKSLEVLVHELRSLSQNIDLFDKYFIGYKIPQIGKEFDLLRIDETSIVNIELKSKSTGEPIEEQLKKNKYYLSFLKKQAFYFCYISDEKKIYTLNSSENLVEVHLRVLLAALVPQKIETIPDIDLYFNPCNYLVSPFNSTDKFVREQYFLTNHQEDIKKTVLKTLAVDGYSIIGIKGKAGSGKTLLIYDIGKGLINNESVLIVHCGYLNKGQIKLSKDYGWPIISIRDLPSDLSKYRLIIVDEAQRIYLRQLENILYEVKSNGKKCIFSYDSEQTLRQEEIDNKIGERIENEVTISPIELTKTIRTNKEVAAFTKRLFDKSEPLKRYRYSNIELNYFNDYSAAKAFLRHLSASGDWKIINYTPSKKSAPYDDHRIPEEEDNAHTVIGQEFDNVVAVIDNNLYYDGNILSNIKNAFYNPKQMLFQIVSRARIKLNIVIIGNPEVLTRCLEILKY